MSLRIIYGKAGSGKTTYCFNEIKDRIKNENKIYIITPEQFSFTAEQKLLDTIEENSTINAEVLTFNRMAYRVLQEVGGITDTVLTDCGTSMLIYDILRKERKNLKFLGKSDKNVDIVNRLFTELKKHNVTENKLADVTRNIDDIYLKTKLNDIDIIYKNYEERIKNIYINNIDLLTMLFEKIKYSKSFDNSLIYIDEFAGFTKQEYLIIQELMKKAKQVNITMCIDILEENTMPETDVFYPNKKAIIKIIQIAKDNNIKIDKPIELNDLYRFKNNELNFLENNLYNIDYKKYEEQTKNINIFLAMNPYSEIEFVSKKIIELVRDNGYRYKDIVIITKNIENYNSIAKAIFYKYGIPVYIDEKKDLSKNILIKLIISMLEIFSKNWSYEAVFGYIKTGLLDIENEDIFVLEKYCIKWGIKGNKWYKEDWNYGNLDSEDLTRLNNLRKRIVDPLINLKNKIYDEKNVRNISKEIYYFLNDNVLSKLESKIKKLEQIGEIEIAREYETGLNIIVEVLDEIVNIFGDEKIGFERYKELLTIGIQNKDLGTIPSFQDQVIFGDIERSRTHKVDVCFIIGMNDGVFPSVNKNEGFLDNKDREVLRKENLEIAKTTIEQLYDEQFNIYKALTIPENKLFLSYTSTDNEGKAIRPSVLISKIKNIFPNIKKESDIIKKESFIGTKESTFDELLENIYKLKDGNSIDSIWYDVYNYYKDDDIWKEKLKTALKGINYSNLPEKINEEYIKELYGKELKTSISRLEQYRKCPYSFYLKYGLKLKEEETFKIQSIDTGTFMHEIIDEFFEYINKNNIDIKSIDVNKIENIIDNIVNEKLNLSKYYKFTYSTRFIILTKRLKNVVKKSIFYIIEQLRNSNFKVLGNEIEFKNGGEYPPIEIELDDNRKIEITGKIDRADYAENDDGKYIRIIDYKSSVKDIDLNEVVYGLQLQLITYLDSITKEENYSSAGILYFNLTDPIVDISNSADEKKIEEEIRKKFKMHGLILADVKVIKMMDNSLEKGASQYIPAYLDKEGNISEKYSSTINKEDFKNLQKQVIDTIKNIGKEIMSGNIDIKPYYDKSKKTPCEYCNYKSICNFNTRNKNNEYNYIKYMDKKEVLKKISEKFNK